MTIMKKSLISRAFALSGAAAVVAAGLLAGVLRKFHEAGIWNQLQEVVFNLDDTLPMDSPLGTVLSGLLGYQSAPVVGEAIVYVAFLAITLYLFLKPAAPSPATTR
mgnify:CR=1 FL=1